MISEKLCRKCQNIKPVDSFHKSSTEKDGYYFYCKECKNIITKESYYRNHEKSKSQKRVNGQKYYSNNKESESLRHKKRRSKPETKKTIREQVSLKRKTDINFKLAFRIRDRIGHAIKQNQKVGSAVDDLGCSINELKIHLEVQFQPGMTWENWSRDGWHIDHIVPLCSFNLENREEFLKACHYSNLRPLWAKDNRLKIKEDIKLKRTTI